MSIPKPTPNTLESVTDFSNIDPKTEISVRKLLEQLESSTPPFVLDIRQPEEIMDDPKIPAAINIPMMQLMARLNELPKPTPANVGPIPPAIVIVCHSGSRSMMAQKFLSAKGYDCKSLAGGMVAWDLAHHY